MVSLFGFRLTGLVSDAYGTANIAQTPWPTTLARTRVLLDGTPAPIQYAFTDTGLRQSQINFQVPFGIPIGQHNLTVQRLSQDGQVEATSNRIPINIVAVLPSWFGNTELPIYLQNVTQDPSGATFVSKRSPARAGDVLTVYATGLGRTNPAYDAGTLPEGLARTVVAPSVQIRPVNDLSAPLTYTTTNFGAAASPQFPGLYQLSFQVPAAAKPDENGLVYVSLLVLGSVTPTFPLYIK
jgi:uncharacterized protein (TIGR03437 family)